MITAERIKTGLIILLVIALCIVFKSCNDNKSNYDSAESYRLATADSLHHFVDKYTGAEVTYKLSAEVNKKELNKILNENQDLKKKVSYYQHLKNVSVIQTNTVIDSFLIPFDKHDTVLADFKPLHFHVDSSFFKVSGIVSKQGLLIDSLVIPNTQTIIVGEKKNGFFKKNEMNISVENSNKLVKVTGLSNINVKEKNAWYQNGWFKVGIGVVVGVLIHKL